MNQWDGLTGLFWTCALSPCVVPIDWWWWLSCLAVLWPDSLECHHSWQKCLGTTAATMRISIHAIAFHDLHRLHLVLVHSLHRKMARQGPLEVGYAEDWQGKGFVEMRQAFYKYEIVTSVSCLVVSEISAGAHMLNKKITKHSDCNIL